MWTLLRERVGTSSLDAFKLERETRFELAANNTMRALRAIAIVAREVFTTKDGPSVTIKALVRTNREKHLYTHL